MKKISLDKARKKVPIGEFNNQEIKTVPNQAYTVKQLLQNHVRGHKPVIEKEPLYEMDDFGENINPIRQIKDLSDLDDIRQELEKVKEYHDKVQLDKANKLKEAKKAKEKEAWLTEYLKEQEKKVKTNP